MPTPVNPKSPFDDPTKHNREIEARRKSEQAAERARAELSARQSFQQVQTSMDSSVGLPPGFKYPEPPAVGTHTEGRFPQGKMSVFPPTEATGNVVGTPEEFNRRAKMDADMMASLEAQAREEQQVQERKAAPARKAPEVKVKPAKTSLILQQLRLDLGIDTQNTIDLTIADHVWSFYPLTPEMTTLALRIAEAGSMEGTERELLQQYAAVCCSIAAIDKEPLWKVFSIEPEKDDDVSFPLLPKGRIRQRAALSLLQELMTNAKLGIMQALLEAYNSEIDPLSVVKGYTEYSKATHFRHTCREAGCKTSLVRIKNIDASSNAEIPYYCEVHGTAMESEPLTSLREGMSPLV